MKILNTMSLPKDKQLYFYKYFVLVFFFILFFLFKHGKCGEYMVSSSLAIKFNDGARLCLALRIAMHWVVCFVYCLGGEYQLNSSSRTCVCCYFFVDLVNFFFL